MKELLLQRQKAHLVLVKEFLLSCEDITESVVFSVYNGVERERATETYLAALSSSPG